MRMHACSSNSLDTKQIRQLEVHHKELLRLTPEHERLTAIIDVFVHINDELVPNTNVKVMIMQILACDSAAHTCLMLPTRPSCLFKDALPSRSVFKFPFATCAAVTSYHALLMCLTALVITEIAKIEILSRLTWSKRVAGFGQLKLQRLIPCMLNFPGWVRSADST
jgi:hypothetical protein